jgi:hypothetical protein
MRFMKNAPKTFPCFSLKKPPDEKNTPLLLERDFFWHGNRKMRL